LNNFGRTVIASEINGLGRAVEQEVRKNYDVSLMYKRYQIDPANRRDKTIPDYGHETTSKNRDLMINTLMKSIHLTPRDEDYLSVQYFEDIDDYYSFRHQFHYSETNNSASLFID
jgi:hypothetical protein